MLQMIPAANLHFHWTAFDNSSSGIVLFLYEALSKASTGVHSVGVHARAAKCETALYKILTSAIHIDV